MNRWLQYLLCAASTLSPFVMSVCHGDEQTTSDFFESQIRPLLADHCVQCHGADKQSGGLRLDSAAGLAKGGDSGVVVVAGQPNISRLIEAVRRSEELQMPPEETLTEQQVSYLERWVELGANWPETSQPVKSSKTDTAKTHWAFQPVGRYDVPSVQKSDWVRTPIDAFILQKLEASGLPMSGEADRRTLIRRATYSVTGMPPSVEDVERFVQDSSEGAYERLIDSLLARPQYGEHWARHWLDVARYSDTKGYVYAREERFWPHAWNYRDWVVNSLNEDLPYNRFLLLQIAADQVPDRRESDLAAMGFLTIGRRFLGVQRDIIDDRIDVVTRGTMSLTVGCARCHDHKYDPIPTADYYSLYGVFASCSERLIPTGGLPEDAEFQKELTARAEKLEQTLQERRHATAERVRQRVGEYLKAQRELGKYPEEGFDQILAVTDILPAFVRRWQNWLHEAKRRNDSVFVAWHAFDGLSAEEFSAKSPGITATLMASPEGSIHPEVRKAFATSPGSFDEVIQRYSEILHRTDEDWRQRLQAAKEAGQPVPVQFDEPEKEALRQILYGPTSPCEVPNESIVNTENDYDSGSCNDLWKLQGDVERLVINAEVPAKFAVVLEDRAEAVTPRIFRRGNPATKGDEVPRQFLSLLSGEDRRPFEQGSGRLEMAQAIISEQNPLTARVMVNRVWLHHFGAGLVSTPGDFGIRSETPTHPELLDWLARRFMDGGWSLKQLHRMILLSSTFRMSSFGPEDETLLQQAVQQDPANRLLWRMNSRRLSFEELRDSMLAVSADLDLTSGGKPADLFAKPYPVRRTIYGLVDRQFLPGTLRMFDFANPDLHIPQRSETTVPQQALFLMNHPASLERARKLSQRVSETAGGDDVAFVRELYRAVLQRDVEPGELEAAVSVLNPGESPASDPVRPEVADWSYGYGKMDEAAGRVAAFTPLPHFTGTAWQGGPNFPDGPLGWVQLSATGGHPGNDREHAVIRRWTAPRAMKLIVETELVHEPEPGDGIRYFIASSRQGILKSGKIHKSRESPGISEIEVEPGEELDFVVDIGDELNSDQYLWRSQIRDIGGAAGATEVSGSVHWDSEKDFSVDSVNQLTVREQLAQVLLCSNEFVFVD
ncbi:MAG: PSD1 domain-containing protein [Planctomyces sp.]|nr:PSD1 domain-containing protein [Planctomyces sp.]